ncbi:hypothetical protein EDC01DRAFT_692859 [Geopyxis carbonaria]|nr:hypothetical protein EDC01DRAFT_692859 [Geopyxis carbonaria]
MSFYAAVRTALTTQDGPALGTLFNPRSPTHAQSFAYSSNHAAILSTVRSELLPARSASGLPSKAMDTLIDAVAALWEVVYELERGALEPAPGYWARAYRQQRELMALVVRGFGSAGWPCWCLPVLYEGCRALTELAVAADAEEAEGRAKEAGRALGRQKAEKAENLEEAARQLNRAFTLCLSDRAPLEESRKWGTYYIVNLLFKTYFKLNAITLSKNVLRALKAVSTDMPALSLFPKSHIVTFKYYVGVISFLDEDYVAAEESLTTALRLSPRASPNQELILTYLIPAHLMTTHQLPSQSTFAAHPRLAPLFAPIAAAIRAGNLLAFERALAAHEDTFVRRRIYLTLERARDICLRNLFRRVFVLGGRKTRISVEEFRRAMGFSLAGKEGGTRKEVEPEEVECLLAGMVYKGLMKGYISREKGMVVLSGSNAFPGTGL